MTQLLFPRQTLISLGRCTSCGWHPPTQGHSPDCAPAPELDDTQYDPTDEQRGLIAQVVEEFESRHTNHGDRDMKRDHRKDGREVRRVGLLGEVVLHNMFGCPIDFSFRRSGDTQDTFLRLVDGRRVPVDVKTSTYTGGEAMIRVPEYLYRRASKNTIYIGARYDPQRDTARLLCWEWHGNVTEPYDFGFGPNRVKRYLECRSIPDLATLVERN